MKETYTDDLTLKLTPVAGLGLQLEINRTNYNNELERSTLEKNS